MAKALTVGKEDFGIALKVPAYLQEAPSVLDTVDIQQNLARVILNNKGRFVLMDGASEVEKLGDSVQIRFLHVHKHMQRRYYEEAYDEDREEVVVPVCWSNDGITPDETSASPQSDKCSNCPMNKKGSGNGGSRKGCGSSRNTLIQLLDPETPMNNDPLLYKINATSHYADPSKDDGSMNWNKLMKLADRNGLALQAYPVEVASDMDGEMGQATFFVINEPATKAEFDEIQALRESLDMDDMVSLSYTPVSDDEQEDAPKKSEARKTPSRKAKSKAAPAKETAAPEGESGAAGESDEGDEGEEAALPAAAAPPGAGRTRRSRKPPVEAADSAAEDDEPGAAEPEANDELVNKYLGDLDGI